MERIYIFFYFFCKVITSTDICDGDKICNFYDYCRKDTKNYGSCYYNIFSMIHLVLIYFITFINIPCFIKRNIYNIMKKIMILYLFVDKQNIH
jgi:hypothetical protein